MSEEQPPYDPTPLAPKADDELKAFMLVLHRSLKMITNYIEKRYDIGPRSDEDRRKKAA